MRLSSLTVGFALLVEISPLFSQTPTSADASEVYRAAAPAVFLVETRTTSGQTVGIGSAFLVEPTRLVTNAHVVEGGEPFLRTGAAALPLRVETIDPNHDLAVLISDLPLEAEPLELETAEPTVGTEVFAIGNPRGLERTLSQGIISGIRDHEGKRLLQITAAISPGSSGGPVVTRGGRVVGVTIGYLEGGQNLNFAIPASTLRELLIHGPHAPGFSEAFADAQRVAARPVPNFRKNYEAWKQYIEERKKAIARAGTMARTGEEHLAVAALAYDNVASELAAKHARLALLAGIPEPDSARILIIRAWALDMIVEKPLSQSDLLHRLEFVDTLLARRPTHAASHAFRARVLSRLGRGAEALPAARQAVEFGEGEDASNWYWYVYHRLAAEHGSPSDDDDVFRKMVGAGAADATDWAQHGDHLHERELWDVAATAYNQAFVLSRERTAEYACKAGQAYWLAELVDSALESLRSCLAAYATSAYVDTTDVVYAHRGIASLLNDRGVHSQAESHARQARALDPENAWATYELARAYLGQQRYTEAAVVAEEAVRLSDGSVASMHFVAGSAYFRLGDWVRCERSFYHADRLAPDDVTAAYNRGLCLAGQGYFRDAANVMEDVLRREPDHPRRADILDLIRTWRN